VNVTANFLDPEVQYVCTVLEEEIDRRTKAGEFVSLRSLAEWVKKLHHAPGWRFSDVYKLLKARGWVFAKANNYQFLQRRRDVRTKAVAYLWLDEQGKWSWFRKSDEAKMRACKTNDGKRFILMAAGCAEIGWIPGAFLVTEAGQ